jgi:hypothetical protein
MMERTSERFKPGCVFTASARHVFAIISFPIAPAGNVVKIRVHLPVPQILTVLISKAPPEKRSRPNTLVDIIPFLPEASIKKSNAISPRSPDEREKTTEDGRGFPSAPVASNLISTARCSSRTVAPESEACLKSSSSNSALTWVRSE